MSKFTSTNLFLLTALAVLPGCADWEKHAQSTLPPPATYYEDKQITVAQTRSVYAVSYEEGKTHLSDNEKAYLADFLNRTVRDHERTVMVERPARGADRLSRQRAAALTQWLSRSGYHIHPFPGAPHEQGAVHIAVDHLMAQAPANCPNWEFPRNFSFGSNGVPGHACADRTNLAAMIADPRDLVVGRVAPAPSGHGPLRGEVNYRNGFPAPLQDAGDVIGAD